MADAAAPCTANEPSGSEAQQQSSPTTAEAAEATAEAADVATAEEASSRRPSTTEKLLTRAGTFEAILAEAEKVSSAAESAREATFAAEAAEPSLEPVEEEDTAVRTEVVMEGEGGNVLGEDPPVLQKHVANAGDLIKGTAQYKEAQAALQAWLEVAGVEGSCLDALQAALEEEEICSLAAFRSVRRTSARTAADQH